MGGKKKREGDDISPIKCKKHKKSHGAMDRALEAEDTTFDTAELLDAEDRALEAEDTTFDTAELLDAEDRALEAEDTTFDTAELLDAETIREGMLLLGCVTGVKPSFLEISLPGFLSGRVPFNNISSPFTDTNTEMEEPSLSFVKIGMIFPCKVIEISRESSKKKSSIVLSINPADINADLKPSLLYPKMVLYVSVCSIEDRGYVVDVGNEYIKGFIPKQYSQDELKIGEVFPTSIEQISSDKTSARIQLFPLDFKEPFPTVSVEDVNLTSILPGARICGYVTDIKFPFIYVKYLCFNACASSLSRGSGYLPAIEIGKQVCGTVLYTCPISHMIYLSLTVKHPQISQSELFGLRKYACVKNLKYFYSYKKYDYYRIKKCTLGLFDFSNTLAYFHAKDLPKSASNDTVSKAYVLRCHYMDNLVRLSAKPSLLEKDIIFIEDVQIGEIYEAVVSKHVHEGMFVRICPGLSGFIRRIHMSDVFVTKPEILHPVGSKIKCRVLYTDGKDELNLTCKESLLKLQDQYTLTSYENVQKGQFYKGVIVQQTEDNILVMFFNDIKGIVPSSNIPKGSVFFEGQTVLCEVIYCNSSRKELKFSLEIQERHSIEEIDDDFWDEPTEKIVNGRSMDVLSSDESLSSVSKEIKSGAYAVKAVIKSFKRNHMNIMFENNIGRVHITELGCTSEDIYPFKGFSIGQEIQVYVIGGYYVIKKKKKDSPVSYQNLKVVNECSMRFPPYTIYNDYIPGKSIMGFVKEVHDVSVLLWLSPYQIGVLDYLHFSENLKTIKSLHRHLNVGQSLKLSVLEDNGSTVAVTKIGKVLPQLGRNIIGLVQIPCSERGLDLKLPFGYHGSVAVTDLTDIYVQVPLLFQKYCKSKFVTCHVLEVNHQTKYCQLSLRKSRIYGKTTVPNDNFCPEITKDDLKVGNTMKGFVKSVSDSVITVNLGRNLEGKIQIHASSSADCKLCEVSKTIIHNLSTIGSVVEVVVKEYFKDGRSCILDFIASGDLHLQEELSSIDMKKQELIKSSRQMGKMKDKYALEPELLEVLENFEVLSNKIQTLVTNYEIDVKRSTIEQLRASPVQLPNSQPSSLKLDEINSKIRQLHEDVDSLNLLTQLTELMKEFQNKALGVEASLKQLDEESQAKERKLDPSDSMRHKLRSQMTSLDEKWNSVKKNAEDYHQMLNEKIAKWSELEERSDNLYESLKYLMVNFENAGKAPVARQRALEEEAKKLQRDLESLQQDAIEFGMSKSVLQKLLKESTTLLAKINMQLDELEALKEPAVKTVVQTEKEPVILLETSNPPTVPDFVAKVNKVREAVAAVNRQLSQSELAGKDFGKQERSLKAVKDGINTLKPNIELVYAEKENVVRKATKTESIQVDHVAEKLKEEWNKLTNSYEERHKKWLKAKEVWQSFESDLRSITSWLVTSETVLAQSWLSSEELDYERAKMHQEMLQNQVTDKMTVIERLNIIGHKISDQCSPPDAILLQEQLESINRRSKSLIAELATRKAKIMLNATG